MGVVDLLRKRRARALKLPRDHPAFGMPIGNDEADLFRVTVQPDHPRTELPFISIASEFWRGLVDLGALWRDVGASAGRADVFRCWASNPGSRDWHGVDHGTHAFVS